MTLSKSQVTRDLTNNEQASLEEVNSFFAPGTGKLWTYYNENLKQWLVQQGGQYVSTPNAAGHVGPAFAAFFNKVAAISSALYPSGRQLRDSTLLFASCPARGLKTPPWWWTASACRPATTVQQFKWNGAVAHQASLAYDTSEALQFQGTWALFQLVNTAHVTRTSAGIELEFPLQVSGRPIILPDGTPQVVRFEVSGPGAQVLVPGGLAALPCVTSVLK